MKSHLCAIRNYRAEQDRSMPNVRFCVILCLFVAPVIAGEKPLPGGSTGPITAAVADGLIASLEPDWPQWRGPRRDGISDENGLLSSWPQNGPKLLWKINGLGTGWSSPIVVGERLYITGDVGDDLVVFAFDRDGAPQWQAKNGRAWKGPYPGARACWPFLKADCTI